MPAIVKEIVTLTQAPTPSTLQGTGAFLSQGATNTSPGTRTLLTQLSSLATFLSGAKPLSTLVQTAGVATATATSAHGFTIGDTLFLTIAGATPTGYNGTFLCTVTTTMAFTYTVPSGTASSATGTLVYTPEDVAELVAMNTTFWAQGTNTPVYVLELGAGNPNDGVVFLNSWIQQNPGVFYSYLVPRTWDANANYLTFLAQFENTTAITYFWTTTTLATFSVYSAQMKCAPWMIEAPAFGVYPANALTALTASGTAVTATTATAHGVAVGQWFQLAGVTPTGYNGFWQAQAGTTGETLVFNVPTALGAETVLGTLVASQFASAGIPATEFSWASGFHVTLSYAPSSSNKVTPFNFSFVFGVTQFPVQGNSSLLTTIATANGSVIGTGAEGGLSDTLISGGNTPDGNPFNFWFAIDWLNININLNISNAVINGSNNPANPLYLNQPGINTLQDVGASTLDDGITFGLIFGSTIQTELSGTDFATALAAGTYAGYAVINAVPFSTYFAANPGNYKIGTYTGFSVNFTPQNGFESITFNLNASTFVG
jgi:hypothetical protein